jgi:hypothetical protein
MVRMTHEAVPVKSLLKHGLPLFLVVMVAIAVWVGLVFSDAWWSFLVFELPFTYGPLYERAGLSEGAAMALSAVSTLLCVAIPVAAAAFRNRTVTLILAAVLLALLTLNFVSCSEIVTEMKLQD